MEGNLSRRNFLKKSALGLSYLALGSMFNCCSKGTKSPNFVIIFTDDQGYKDVGCFGAQNFKTPHLDKMADNGRIFTDFHVASPVCSPSRAALLTGCYPQRVGIPTVLFPEGPFWTEGKTKIGLSKNEITIAEMLKQKDFATACIGKWHLGHHKQFLPTNHGFDEYFGLPYSNDMRPETHPDYPPLPLLDGTEVVEENPDQSQLTRKYTERAVKFINQNQNKPFFLYLAHTMPHVPLYCSEKFKGKSKQGMYGDVIMEIDWSVGQIMTALKANDLDQNTLVIFTSDNGPWTVFGNHAGSADPLRGCKQTTFEGGQRVPCIMKWKDRVPAGTICKEFATTMDILPTLASMTNSRLPDKKIDGYNISHLIFGKGKQTTPYEAFYYYDGNTLKAIRSGKWKLHLPHNFKGVKKPGMDGKMGEYFYDKIELSLFNLENDIDEDNNVAQQYPEVVERMLKYAEQARRKLGDKDKKGIEVREPGKV